MAPSFKILAAPSSPGTTATQSSIFQRPLYLYLSAVLLRLSLILYGLWQDAHSSLKYTDIDYLVFTDAARFVSHGASPYDRATYRYTPLLAWLLLPTAWQTPNPRLRIALFSSGKLLFAASDLLAGWLIEWVLRMQNAAMDPAQARIFSALWLLNPMVVTISTRGSSEGLLGVLVIAMLWAVLARKTALAGLLLGVSVHWKIYPFVYAPTILWWMGGAGVGSAKKRKRQGSAKGVDLLGRALEFLTPDRVRLCAVSCLTFMALNVYMLAIYGIPFITHTYLHHVTRIDHRHNFSPYNVQLYLSSASSPIARPSFGIESIAFLPQLLLVCVLIPFATAKQDLPTSMMAQTFAFVTFNKVCTSQYFLWYMVFLPLYLPRSSFLRNKLLGVAALALWVGTQALWLQQGYALEFLGESTFVPGLWLASLAFFLVNCWILGVIVGDAA